MMCLSLGLCAVLSVAATNAGAGASKAREIVAAVESRHRQLHDFEARFVQAYRSGVMGQEVVESGRLRFLRPGRMRWEYQKPERKLFVCDGSNFYFYVPGDRQVVVKPRGSEQGLAFRLLAGDVAIEREFSVTVERAAADGSRLRLTPRRANADVESIVLEVDAGSQLRGLEIHDLSGSVSRFSFLDLRENRGLTERDFRFTIPAGVEVIRE